MFYKITTFQAFGSIKKRVSFIFFNIFITFAIELNKLTK